MSARIAELVGARVEGLDDAERRALDIVSLGEPLGLGIVEELVDPAALLASNGVAWWSCERTAGGASSGSAIRSTPMWSERRPGRSWRRPSGASLPRGPTPPACGAGPTSSASRRGSWKRVAADATLLLGAAHETYRARDMAGTARMAAGAWDVRPDATSGYLLGPPSGSWVGTTRRTPS